MSGENTQKTAQTSSKRPTKAPNWKKGQSGNPKGRPKGSRNKLTTKFIDTLAADFELHGEKVIKKLRKTDPKAYVMAVGKLVPKEIDIDTGGDVTIQIVKEFKPAADDG